MDIPKEEDKNETAPSPVEPVITDPAPEIVSTAAETTVPMQETAPVQSAPAEVGYTETESNKLVYVFIGVLVVILLSLVGLFFYKQFTGTTSVAPSPTPVLDQVVETQTATPATPEEAELENLDIPDIDQELNEIDTDLKAL